MPEGGAEGRVFQQAELFQTAVQHIEEKLLVQQLIVVSHILELFTLPRPGCGNCGIGIFGIRGNYCPGFRIVGYGVNFAGSGVFLSGNLGKILLQQSQRFFFGQIPDHDHTLQIRTVPVLVETYYFISCKRSKHFVGTDRGTIRITAAGKSHCRDGVRNPALSSLAHTPFFDDHAALFLQFLLSKTHFTRHIGKDQKAFFQLLLVIRGNLELVHSKIVTRHGIQAIGKAHADGGKVIYHFASAKMGTAIESHVLGEMRQTLLILIFDDAADIHEQTQLCPVLGFGVFHDIICNTILQNSGKDIRILRKRDLRYLFGNLGKGKAQCHT